MKVGKLLIAGIILATALSACKLDFKNEGEDKWVVSNESQNPVLVSFNEDEVSVPTGKSLHSFPFNASISIDDEEHVNFTTSYSYTESTVRRSLKITGQNEYQYEITNSTDSPITFEYYYKHLKAVTNVTAGTPDENNITTYEIAASETGSIVIYNSQPTLTFKKGTTELTYTSTTDTNGTVCIIVK